MKKQDLRAEMPKTAAFIDLMREQWGTAFIDDLIRRGMRGEPTFHSIENGHTIGTPMRRMGVRVGTDARGNRCLLDGPVPGEAVSQNETMRENYYNQLRKA